jgi:hypothetical protein
VLHHDEHDAHGDTHADAAQHVGEDDGERRHDEGDEVARAEAPRMAPERRRRQTEAGDEQHRGDGGKRNAVEERAQGEGGGQHQHGVHEHRQPRPCAGVDVGRRADHDAGNRQPAEQPRRDVADAVREQLAVDRRLAPQRVQLARRLEAEQCLEAGDEGDDDGELPHAERGQAAPVGHDQMRRHGAEAHVGQRDEMGAAHRQIGQKGSQRLVHGHAERHGDERRRQQPGAREGRARPPEHHRDAEQRRDDGGRLDLLQGLASVLSVVCP